jgi:hypothetical protein
MSDRSEPAYLKFLPISLFGACLRRFDGSGRSM